VDQAKENEYRSAIGGITPPKAADPWGNVRETKSQPAAPAKKTPPAGDKNTAAKKKSTPPKTTHPPKKTHQNPNPREYVPVMLTEKQHVFLREVGLQLRYAIEAVDRFHEAKGKNAGPDSIFRALDDFVHRLARVSLLLWPVRTGDQARGAELRNAVE